MRLLLPSLLLLALPHGIQAAAAPASVSFDRDIAPLLIRRCIDCHSGSHPKGKLDLTRKAATLKQLVAGKVEESYLWQRIKDDEMPPKKPLSDVEKSLIRRWIQEGAKWETDPINPFRFSNTSRAGLDWWSLQPIRRTVPPTVKNVAWTHNAVDRFILERLEQKKLSPSPPTDRATLLRRLSFDLIGLPPTPDEITAFVNDTRPDAYLRQVNRLLAGPHHGERWGRHWLDIVRFGESDGFERDLPRFNAWPYRDWVVKAFNADLPYNEFARLQLAGDLLQPGDPDALAATGFLVAGAHDIVVPVSANMRASMLQDEMEDIIGTVGQTFLGLTVNCARCHDHKFDPIPQRDYYRMAAGVAGVRHGERAYVPAGGKNSLPRLLAVEKRLRRDLDQIEEPIRRVLREQKQEKPQPGPKPVAEWDFTRNLKDQIGALHVKLHGGAKQSSAGLHVGTAGGYGSSTPLKTDLREKTIEAWVKLNNLTQRGGGVISVQTLDGNTFDALVFGEQQPRRWMAGSDFFRRTKSFNGPEEAQATKQIVHVAITYASDGTITAYRDGKPYGTGYQSGGSQAFAAGKSHLLFGLRHGTSASNRLLEGTIVRARLYDRALSEEEVAASAGIPVIRRADILSRLNKGEREKHEHLSRSLEKVSAEIASLQKQTKGRIYAVNSTNPPPTRVLLRGNVTSPAETVSAEVILALEKQVPETKTAPDAGDAKSRTALTDWITDSRNPLFARVIVNRLWQYHFGIGLVDTSSDFGFNGGRPTHPELLDWLASELVSSGWSLKHVHRLIVTSAAYQQSSRNRIEAAKVDAENRLLWRKSPMRLEAEAVRDAMLSVTGQLDTTMGGPPYLDFKTYFFKGTQFYDPLDQVGEQFARRSIYRMWARGGRSSLLDNFDCPDPSSTTPRRAVTTTPLQALSLLNNAFVLDQASRFAARVKQEVGDNSDLQIQRAYLLALGREPFANEKNLVAPFVARHGLQAFCRVLFNTGAFIQVD